MDEEDFLQHERSEYMNYQRGPENLSSLLYVVTLAGGFLMVWSKILLDEVFAYM